MSLMREGGTNARRENREGHVSAAPRGTAILARDLVEVEGLRCRQRVAASLRPCTPPRVIVFSGYFAEETPEPPQ